MADLKSCPPAREKFTTGGLLPRVLSPLRPLLAPAIDRMLGLHGLNRVYDAIPDNLDPHAFAQSTLDGFGVAAAISGATLDNIPAEGPCIVVANHPHGGLDGVIMIDLLMRRRKDVRVMANHLLKKFVELSSVFVGVDPFGGKQAARSNIRAVRQALGWVRDGGLLMMFPGGEVSSIDVAQRCIVDPQWDGGVAWLIEKSGAPVAPAFIKGRNSSLFQIGGLIHPRVRTALLVREMLGQKGAVVEVAFGKPIPAPTLQLLGDNAHIARYLRASTYLLKARGAGVGRSVALGPVVTGPTRVEPVAAAIEPGLLRREVEQLPDKQHLVTSGRRQVFYAAADQIPWLLQEIGRLREISFREVGEGTGKKADLDLYDSYYLHLFVWDTDNACVVGGYRLGRASDILRKFGPKGLYVRSLFKMSAELQNELHASIEVGRSFVRPDQQRAYSSLMLLWKGIGAYVARHPQYRVLFGPVSISNDYHPLSQQIIVQFLRRTSMEPHRASQVKPHRPFPSPDKATQLIDLDVSDLRIIANLLHTVEGEDKGLPVLLRQYLKLNGRILGFNVDPNFNNAIDCLLWVDLAKTDASLLRKYMGHDGAVRFRGYHGLLEETAAGP